MILNVNDYHICRHGVATFVNFHRQGDQLQNKGHKHGLVIIRPSIGPHLEPLNTAAVYFGGLHEHGATATATATITTSTFKVAMVC